MKKLIPLILVFLLLSPVLVAAETGSAQVKTIDKSGNIVKVGGEKPEPNSNATPAPSIPISNMIAGQLMLENAGKNLTYWVGDSFKESALEINKVDITDDVTGAKNPKYSLYQKEIKPFSAPNVRIFLLLCLAFHIFASLFFIFLGIGVYSAGTIWPKEVGHIRAGFSGSYSQFDVKSYLLICGCVLLLPALDGFGIWYSVLFRNGLASFMNTQMIEVLNTASDNLVNYILFNITLYVNYLEKMLGEYTVYMMTSFVFIKTWITAFILLFGSLKQAAVLHFAVMIGFILVLIMDIQTLFFISSGVILSVWRDNPGFSLAGMIVGGFIDAVILLFIFGLPSLILFTKAKHKLLGVV